MTRRQWAVTAGIGGTGLAAWVGRTFWQAEQAQHLAAASVASDQLVAFAENLLAPSTREGIHPLASPANFRGLAQWEGRLWVISSQSLLGFTGEGVLEKTLRCGIELPSAPLVALLAAGAAGSNGIALWLATEGAGLLQYDGNSVKQFLPKDPKRAKLSSLLALGSGTLLLGTQQGVLGFDGRTMQPHHPDLAQPTVTRLAGQEESLWVGTANQGAWCLRAGQITKITTEQGLPDPRVNALCVGEETSLIGTPVGAVLVRDGKIARQLFAGSHILTLDIAKDQATAGTLQDGLLRTDWKTDRPRPGLSGFGNASAAAPAPVQQLVRAGDAVLAVEPRRVVRLGTPTQVIVQGEETMLSDGNVAALHLAADGKLWVGYFDHGLDVVSFAGDSASVARVRDDVVFCVNRIVGPTRSGRMAVATANGLVWFDAAGTRRQTVTRADGLLASHATDVLLLPSNTEERLAVATPAGLSFLGGGAIDSVYAFHGLVNNHVYSLAWHGNEIFAGTLGGISRYSSGQVQENFTTANSGLRANWVTALLSTGPLLLAGTYGAGIFRYGEDRRWSAFGTLPKDLVINPGAMALLSDGGVAAGSLADGLWVYRANTGWRNFRQGLPCLNVTALASGSQSLYIGTENGLVRMDERVLA